MSKQPTDDSVLARIQTLVDEEHRLYAGEGPDEDRHTRLEAIKITLDQCWDLLRQRRALREFGEDPNAAHVRPARIVEGYEQ